MSRLKGENSSVKGLPTLRIQLGILERHRMTGYHSITVIRCKTDKDATLLGLKDHTRDIVGICAPDTQEVGVFLNEVVSAYGSKAYIEWKALNDSVGRSDVDDC